MSYRAASAGFFSNLGPGLITGAADDDPSGIATYSITGAAYALLLAGLLFWTSYRLIARIFKWLTLALFAYLAAAFLAHPD